MAITLEQATVETVIANLRRQVKDRAEIQTLLTTPEHFDAMYKELRERLETDDSWSKMQDAQKDGTLESDYSTSDVEYFRMYGCLRGQKHTATGSGNTKTDFEKVDKLLDKGTFTQAELVALAGKARVKAEQA
jgi:hypothetical protein